MQFSFVCTMGHVGMNQFSSAAILLEHTQQHKQQPRCQQHHRTSLSVAITSSAQPPHMFNHMHVLVSRMQETAKNWQSIIMKVTDRQG